MEEILKKYSLLKDQNFSRETFIDFESFIDMNNSNSINVSRGTFWSFSSRYFLKNSSIKL